LTFRAFHMPLAPIASVEKRITINEKRVKL